MTWLLRWCIGTTDKELYCEPTTAESQGDATAIARASVLQAIDIAGANDQQAGSIRRHTLQYSDRGDFYHVVDGIIVLGCRPVIGELP